MATYQTTGWVSLKDGLPTDESAGFDKKNKDGYHMGGCYMYAYDPSGEIVNEQPDHLDSRVIYIGTAGSSTSRGIRSRTADFWGTVRQGYTQKNPYANGILFRGHFGEDLREHLYVAYIPMGYGSHIKLAAHGLETELLYEYKCKYGSLPCCDGNIPNVLNAKELLKVMTDAELAEMAEIFSKKL